MADDTFFPGNARLTRMVKKLARVRGVEVHETTRWNGYGYAVVEYRVRADVLDEARTSLAEQEAGDRLRAERREARLRERREVEERERRERHRAEWEADLATRVPRLTKTIPYPDPVYDAWDGVPTDLWSKSHWRLLHCRLRPGAAAVAHLARHQGATVVPLYNSASAEWVAPRPARTGERLWAEYQARGLDLAHAIWVSNRLVKINAGPSDRRQFYRLKDRFLEVHRSCLVEGRVSRVETRECWACGGEGGWCDRCGGTGDYSSRTLYEHRLRVGGRVYCFHSYVRPASLSDRPGADLPSYGRRFTPAELRAIPFSLPAHLLMLEHVLEERP